MVGQPLETPGRRVDLGGEATLFIPAGYRPETNRVDVVLHLHGAPTVIEPAMVKVGWRGILIEFNRKGLSSVYTKPFADPALFSRLLDGALKSVREAGLSSAPKLGTVVVSAFSAGFGGVRELLKVPENFARIDGLVLADSLYCGYVGDPKLRQVDPALMDGFRRFAREAAAGRKSMLVTHSTQVPEGYASTTETADDLIASLGGTASPSVENRGPGLVETRRFTRRDLLILGFAGAGPEDHMAHLRSIDRLWIKLPGWSPKAGSVRP